MSSVGMTGTSGRSSATSWPGSTQKHIRPVIGKLQVGRVDGELLDSFYAELRRCREHCDGRKSRTDQRTTQHECDDRCGPHQCKHLSAPTIRQIHWILSGAYDAPTAGAGTPKINHGQGLRPRLPTVSAHAAVAPTSGWVVAGGSAIERCPANLHGWGVPAAAPPVLHRALIRGIAWRWKDNGGLL